MRRSPIRIKPGVNPSPDNTNLTSVNWVDSNRIRFHDGKFQSVGGCLELSTGSGTMLGFARFVMHYRLNSNVVYTILGTHKKLYAVLGNVRTNITPLKTTGTTLGANPIAAVNGSKDITITYNAHGYSAGDRIGVTGATLTAGIPAAEINVEFIIKSVTTNTIVVTVSTTAATSTASGGGAAVVLKGEIAAGRINSAYGYGYGMGLYGVGLYGVAKTGYYPVMPRIWSGDFFGTKIVLCPGTTDTSIGASIYEWGGDLTKAPTVVTNAPTNANYVFVDNNQVVALCDKTIKWSDVGDQTIWTAAATNSAGERELYTSGRLLSRAYSNGENLLFTANSVWKFRSIGKPYLWESEKLDVADGISGVHAAKGVGSEIIWMGRKNVWRYNGSSVVPLLPDDMKLYLDSNIDKTQLIKSHVLHETTYNELWFFYQSKTSTTDVNRYLKYNLSEQCWDYGAWDRTASEFNSEQSNPYLAYSTGDDTTSTCKIIYHESGLTDNGSPLNWFITTNYAQMAEGDETFYILGLENDAIQTGDASVTVYTKLAASSSVERTFGPYTLAETNSEAIPLVNFRAHGRMRKYKFSSSATSSFFRQGKIAEFLEKGDGR